MEVEVKKKMKMKAVKNRSTVTHQALGKISVVVPQML